MYNEINYSLFKQFALKNINSVALPQEGIDTRNIEAFVKRFNREKFSHKLIIRKIYQRGDYAGHFIQFLRVYWVKNPKL